MKWIVKEEAAIDVHQRQRVVGTLPGGLTLEDAGLRFVDIDEDGFDDIVFSDDERYSVHLSMDGKGWGQIIKGKRGERPAEEEIPPIVSKGTNNGAWVHSRHLWWQNENTDKLPNLVDRRSFNDVAQGMWSRRRSRRRRRWRSMRVAAGVRGRAGGRRAAGDGPDRAGVRGGWEAVGSGDGGLSERSGWEGEAGRSGCDTWRTPTATGVYDKSTVFLDELAFPTGVMPWRKGVLVTCAPEIFYAEDTDGDGKADQRRGAVQRLCEGEPAAPRERAVLRAGQLGVWGERRQRREDQVDQDGKQCEHQRAGFPIPARIRANLSAQTGQTQFGRTRDDWGNDFGCNNPNPMFHFALADHYLRRNPHVAPPNPVVHGVATRWRADAGVSDQPGRAAVQ